MTVAVLLCLVLFAAVFTFVQAIVMIVLHTSQQEEARKQIKKVKEAKGFREFMLRKQIALKKHGADVFLSDGITVGQWYLYKTMIGAVFAFIALLITKGFMNSSIRHGDIVDVYAKDPATDQLVLMVSNVYVEAAYDNSGNELTREYEAENGSQRAVVFTVKVAPDEIEQMNLAVCYEGIQLYLTNE